MLQSKNLKTYNTGVTLTDVLIIGGGFLILEFTVRLFFDLPYPIATKHCFFNLLLFNWTCTGKYELVTLPIAVHTVIKA